MSRTNEQQDDNNKPVWKPAFMPNGPFKLKPRQGDLGYTRARRQGHGEGIWQITQTANKAFEDEKGADGRVVRHSNARAHRLDQAPAYREGFMPGTSQTQYQRQPTNHYRAPKRPLAEEPTYDQHFSYGADYRQQIFSSQQDITAQIPEDAGFIVRLGEVTPKGRGGVECRASDGSTGGDGSTVTQIDGPNEAALLSTLRCPAARSTHQETGARPPPPEHPLSATAPSFHPISALLAEAYKDLEDPESFYRDYMPSTSPTSDALPVNLGPNQELPVNKASPTSFAQILNTVQGIWPFDTDGERACFPGLLSCEASTGGRPTVSHVYPEVMETYHMLHTGVNGKKLIFQQRRTYLHDPSANVKDLRDIEEQEFWVNGAPSALAAARWVLLE